MPGTSLLNADKSIAPTLLGVLVCLGACQPEGPPTPMPTPPSVSVAAAPPTAALASSDTKPPELPPLASPEPLVSLPLAGHGPATVALPRGATTPRPVVVALHGHAVRPEHACTHWSRASHGYAFVVCPHGLPADAAPDAAVTFGSAALTRSEIAAGLAALRDRYGRHVAEGPTVLAGYSMGAKLGVQLVLEDTSSFSTAVFGEGGYADLTQRVADEYARKGVRSVLLVCSTVACVPTFEQVRKRLERAGVPVRLTSSGGTRHMFEGAVAEATRAEWPWLVAGLPGWTGMTAR